MQRSHVIFCAALPFTHRLSGRTKHLAEEMAAKGVRVTYLETMTRHNLFRPAAVREGDVRVLRLSPFPRFHWVARRLPQPLWLPHVQRRFRNVVGDPARATLVVSTPFWLPWLERLDDALVCYDYLDHLSVHAANTQLSWMQQLDAALLRRTDLVTTVSDKLAVDLRRRAPDKRVCVIPNGVPSQWLSELPQPLDRGSLFKDSKRPIIGFVGALYEWVDLELIRAVANALPEADIVLVGPRRSGVSMRGLWPVSNIHIYPSQPFDRVRRWMEAFDVCLIPFKQNIVSQLADPLKLYEYLALGKPVVSTHLFGPPEDAAPIYVGATAPEFIACVRKALAEDGHTAEPRRVFASRHCWSQRADDLLSAIQSTARRRVA